MSLLVRSKSVEVITNVDRTKNNEVNVWRVDGCIMLLLGKEFHQESKNEENKMREDDDAGISKDKHHETDGVYEIDEGDDTEHSTFIIESFVIM